MCDYMHYEEPRRYRAKKMAEPEPELERIEEEQPMTIRA
jgi:hypothetical protein